MDRPLGIGRHDSKHPVARAHRRRRDRAFRQAGRDPHRSATLPRRAPPHGSRPALQGPRWSTGHLHGPAGPAGVVSGRHLRRGRHLPRLRSLLERVRRTPTGHGARRAWPRGQARGRARQEDLRPRRRDPGLPGDPDPLRSHRDARAVHRPRPCLRGQQAAHPAAADRRLRSAHAQCGSLRFARGSRRRPTRSRPRRSTRHFPSDGASMR